MLEIGVCNNCDGSPGSIPQHLSVSESRAQMSLWAVLKSPLLAGLDPTNTTLGWAIDILVNKDVVAISQVR